MKKKIITSGLSLLFLTTLVACGGKNNPTSTNLEPAQTSSTVSPSTGGTPATSSTTDNSSTNGGATSTSTVVETKPSDTLKLTREVNENSNFVDDGIGYATLQAATDGDTATFNLTNVSDNRIRTVRIRFQDIDTPESTGTVEKWGKYASKFTESILNSASSFILEGPSAGEKDSYGERYLGWVWYKTDEMKDYVNLNLLIVENGFSESKANGGHAYDSYFAEAQKYAKNHNLHIWSNEDDPYYTDKPIETTIAELNADLKSQDSQFYNREEKTGAKVTFTGYIRSVTKSPSGTYTYLAEAFDEDGNKSSINLYGGYASDTINSNLFIGHLYHIVGSVQLYNNNFQIAVGGTYVAMTTGDKYTYRLQKDYMMIFDSTNDKLHTKSETGIRSYATVTDVKEEGDLLIITASVFEKSKTETDVTETYTFRVLKPTSYTQMKVGATFSVIGYQFEKDSKVVDILSYNDISFIK